MSFEKSMSIFDDMQDEINQEVRATGLNVLRLLVQATPVDTGTARGNWYVSPSATPDRSVDDSRRASTATNEGSQKIAQVEVIRFPTIVISNSLPYIEKLNQGASKQAPAMFVELAIQRVERA